MVTRLLHGVTDCIHEDPMPALAAVEVDGIPLCLPHYLADLAAPDEP